MATTKSIEVSCRRRSVRDDKEDRLVQIDPPNIFEDGPSARICLLITSNGLTTFSELRRIFPLNYGLYVNRVKLESPLNVANLMNVADELPTVASEILPDIKVDAMEHVVAISRNMKKGLLPPYESVVVPQTMAEIGAKRCNTPKGC